MEVRPKPKPRPPEGQRRVKFNARICEKTHHRAALYAEREHGGNFSAGVEALIQRGLRRTGV